MKTSHHSITAHALVILTEMNSMPQNRSHLLVKLSFAETLEKISTSITEEAWLYNQYTLNISLYYLHFLSYYLFLYIFS